MAGGTPRSTSSRAKNVEPETGPETPSGTPPPSVTEVELMAHETPKIELKKAAPPKQSEETAPPEQSQTPARLPRLNERISVSGVWRAVNERYPSRAVALVQGALAGSGHDPGPFDGIGGQRTRAALAAFAAEHGTELTDMDSLAEALDALGFDI